ncbi:MAG: PIG-L family deacetylase [Kiritimatiellae bacterium]|nr:PIG-L family deacetylase [Kiritimatiellia bacterium]
MKRPRLWIVAPHPDDECITGLLALRLQRECGFGVTVSPATLGSLRARRAARREELRAACAALGWVPWFGAAMTDDPQEKVRRLAARWRMERPDLVFLPHALDNHPTHRATHRWGAAAMDAAGGAFRAVETEYWHPLLRPNLMVAASAGDLRDLAAALSLHRGEVARNDYASRLPDWMSDNVRRGAELVGGPGAGAPKMAHATLYRARIREGGRWRAAGGGLIAGQEELARWVARFLPAVPRA